METSFAAMPFFSYWPETDMQAQIRFVVVWTVVI
jgi:hypothetical protein